MASKYDDLEKLAELRDKGIITEEEFNKKKSEILNLSAQTDSNEASKTSYPDYGQSGADMDGIHAINSSDKVPSNSSPKKKRNITAILIFGIITLVITCCVFDLLSKGTIKSSKVSSSSPIEILEKSTVNQIDPVHLGRVYNFMSEYTDIQRKNTEKEIIGKVIVWKLPVHKVNRIKDNTYRIQTTSGDYVGTFAEVIARNEQESTFIEGLKTGSVVTYKGKIAGITMGKIDVTPAILFAESAQVTAAPAKLATSNVQISANDVTGTYDKIGPECEGELKVQLLPNNKLKIAGYTALPNHGYATNLPPTILDMVESNLARINRDSKCPNELTLKFTENSLVLSHREDCSDLIYLGRGCSYSGLYKLRSKTVNFDED